MILCFSSCCANDIGSRRKGYAMTTIGMMKMPVDFKYKKIHLMGRPRHEKYSEFWRKHIPMDQTHRAKQFAPFDALDGFDEAIYAKEVLYVEQKRMDEDKLNQKLAILRERRRPVKITYFVPCSDENNDAFEEGRGLYKTVTGTVEKIDEETETLRIGGLSISFDDIRDINFDGETGRNRGTQ